MLSEPAQSAPRPVRQIIPPAEGADKFLRLAEVEDMVGYKKNWIYGKIRTSGFPGPHHPGGASSRWSWREVDAWMQEVKAARAA